jgi:hypothetical protein
MKFVHKIILTVAAWLAIVVLVAVSFSIIFGAPAAACTSPHAVMQQTMEDDADVEAFPARPDIRDWLVAAYNATPPQLGSEVDAAYYMIHPARSKAVVIFSFKGCAHTVALIPVAALRRRIDEVY